MSIFSKIQSTRPKKNTFDLSHDRKFSMKIGEITPILCMDCVPGDDIRMNTSQMLRFAPMIAPVMHQISVYTHFFFVPNRLLWSEWEEFITGGREGTSAPLFPVINTSVLGTGVGTLSDYLGLPDIPSGGNDHFVSALPYAAYQTIYSEYYRDQNLIDDIEVSLINGDQDGVTTARLVTMRTRAWQHDYFTSALPFTQKGPEATVPIGDSAPIVFTPNGTATLGKTINTGSISLTGDLEVSATAGQIRNVATTNFMALDNSAQLSADLSGATASSINDLRRAFKLQEWLEKNARGGSRYIETIMSHFGVRSSDARLNRPEFLGGGSSPVTISEVLQTSGTDAEPTPQGNMSGHAISVGGSNNFRYKCEEHGYIIGVQTVMPGTAYQQGVPKHWLKFDKFDYYWPSFAHLGEQPILNQELYADPSDSLDDDTFGYTPRYAEYKYMNSSVHGEYKTTLDFWHMGRKFSTRPFLTQSFIECTESEVNRIFAVTQDEHLYCHTYHRIKAKRPMPIFGTPSLM